MQRCRFHVDKICATCIFHEDKICTLADFMGNGISKRIELKLLLYNSRKAIYASSQVDITAGYEGAVRMKSVQHDHNPLRILSMNLLEALS